MFANSAWKLTQVGADGGAVEVSEIAGEEEGEKQFYNAYFNYLWDGIF
jgi:hypothetical protein